MIEYYDLKIINTYFGLITEPLNDIPCQTFKFCSNNNNVTLKKAVFNSPNNVTLTKIHRIIVYFNCECIVCTFQLLNFNMVCQKTNSIRSYFQFDLN